MSEEQYQLAVRIIARALNDTIREHGPITHRAANNAAKRVAHKLAQANEKAGS